MDSLRPFQEAIIPPVVWEEYDLADEEMLSASELEERAQKLERCLIDESAWNWISDRSPDSAAKLKSKLDASSQHVSSDSLRYFSGEALSTPEALASRLFALKWKERSKEISCAAKPYESKSFYSTCKSVCQIKMPTLLASGLNNALVRFIVSICVLRFAYRQFCHLKVLTDSFVNLHVISKITNKNALLLIKISDTFVKYLWVVNVISYSYITYRVATILIKQFGPVAVAWKNNEADKNRKKLDDEIAFLTTSLELLEQNVASPQETIQELRSKFDEERQQLIREQRDAMVDNANGNNNNDKIAFLTTSLELLEQNVVLSPETIQELRSKFDKERQQLIRERDAIVGNANGDNGGASYRTADSFNGLIDALGSKEEMDDEQAKLLQQAEIETRGELALEQIKSETASLFFTPGLAICWATIRTFNFTRLCLNKVQEFLSTIAEHGKHEQNTIAKEKAFALWLRSLGLEAPV